MNHAEETSYYITLALTNISYRCHCRALPTTLAETSITAPMVEGSSSAAGSRERSAEEVSVGYVPARSGRRCLLLLDSEGLRCRRAAAIDIAPEILAGMRDLGESRGAAIARIQREYVAVDWIRTSLLWRGTRLLRHR